MPGYESIMLCGRAPDGLPRVLSLDNDGHIPGIGTHRYYTKVLSYGPIAYWPLWDAVLPTAEELVNSPAQDGAHSNVTLGQPGIGDGRTSCFYNGGGAATSYTTIQSASLDIAFNGAELTILMWVRVSGAGVWTDGVERRTLSIYVGAGDFIQLRRTTVNGQFNWRYRGGGIEKSIAKGGLSTTDWMYIGLTVSQTDDAMKAYYAGIQEGLTQNGLGAWGGGGMHPNFSCIGSHSIVPTNVWHGYIAHTVVFDRALSPADILDLSVV